MEKLFLKQNLQNSKSKNSPYLAIQLLYTLVAFDFFREVMPSMAYIFYHPNIEFIFPNILSFLSFFDARWITTILMISSFPVYILAAVKYQSQFYRILVFIHFLVARGLMFSYVRYSHLYFPIFWVMMCLCVCPHFSSPVGKKYFQKTYYACLFSLALFYFYPGVWKIILGWQKGLLSHIDSGSSTIAYYLLTHGKLSFLGDFFIFNSEIAYFSFAVVVAFQLSALFAVFYPPYQRLWAVFSLIFHVTTIFIVSVNFFMIGVVVFIFFYFSPLANSRNDWLYRLTFRLLPARFKKLTDTT